MFMLPSGATLSRTEEVTRQIENYFLSGRKGQRQGHHGRQWIQLRRPRSKCGQHVRAAEGLESTKWCGRSRRCHRPARDQALSAIRDAQVFTLNPPVIMGLGQVGGFEFQLLANGGTSRAALAAIAMRCS